MAAKFHIPEKFIH